MWGSLRLAQLIIMNIAKAHIGMGMKVLTLEKKNNKVGLRSTFFAPEM